MPQPNDLKNSLKESQIQLALQAIKRDATINIPRAVALYKVCESTLRRRLIGKPSRQDCAPNSMNLLMTEEEVIIKYILDLDTRGFPLRLPAIKDLADSLLAARNRDPIGPN